MTSTLFAILELERDPLAFSQLSDMFKHWIQGAGGFAAVGLVIFLVSAFRKTDSSVVGDKTRAKLLPWVIFFATLAIAAYVTAGVIYKLEPPSPVVPVNPDPQAPKPLPPPPTTLSIWRDHVTTLGGAFAIIAIGLPFLADLLKIRWRRVWALAKLSFKEAVRRRVLWVFLAFLLIFLFPPKWFKEGKPVNDVRDAVAVIDFAQFAILLLAFSLLAAFSIPNDLRSQTMHTIVTKPVERFEIVLGRFFGYVGLATIVLFAMRAIAVLLIFASNVSDEAKFQSFQARIPVYGTLEFRKSSGAFEGESVGREWEYRKFIAGGPTTRHRAVFGFNDFPSQFASETAVPVEFAFDIFRTHKGEEGKGVQVSLFFSTPDWTEDKKTAYQEELTRLGLNPNRSLTRDDPSWSKWNQLAEKYGYYEIKGKEIDNARTFQVLVPGGLFKRASAMKLAEPNAPRLIASVKCDSRSQFLGVAKWDLYLLEGTRPFALNFIMGGFGTWLMLVLTIGLAVTCSTCLSGVVSWLTAAFIVGTGFFRDFIGELAEGRAVGGGPVESLIRLGGNMNIISDMPDSAAKTIAESLDKVFAWIFHRVLNFLPDVERFDWSNYVAEGFSIPFGQMGMTALVLFAYLLPWAVLAYYLMKSREIAN